MALSDVLEIVNKAKNIRKIVRQADRLAEDFVLIVEQDLDKALAAAVRDNPELRPILNVINRAERLVRAIQEGY